MPTIALRNVEFHYEESGRGSPLVLLHGFPHDSRLWAQQVAALSDRFRVIAPDLRGFGKSKSSLKFTIESLADDVRDLLKQIGALPCVLAGLSMGGYVALAFARKYRSDLRGLGLIDTKAEADSFEAKVQRDKMIELAKEKGPEAIAEQMLPKMLSVETFKQRPAVVESTRAMMDSQSKRTLKMALAAMRDRPDFTIDLASVSVPTLILVGDQDKVTPPSVADAMSRLVRNPTLRIVRGAAHLSPIDQPDEVNDALRRFMEAAE